LALNTLSKQAPTNVQDVGADVKNGEFRDVCQTGDGKYKQHKQGFCKEAHAHFSVA
jgi:hypothetical protein